MKNLLKEFTGHKQAETTTGKHLKSDAPKQSKDKINIANVAVPPTSVEERDAARRASVKVLSSRSSLKKAENSNSSAEPNQKPTGKSDTWFVSNNQKF
jgi:hypothetical protein